MDCLERILNQLKRYEGLAVLAIVGAATFWAGCMFCEINNAKDNIKQLSDRVTKLEDANIRLEQCVELRQQGINFNCGVFVETTIQNKMPPFDYQKALLKLNLLPVDKQKKYLEQELKFSPEQAKATLNLSATNDKASANGSKEFKPPTPTVKKN